MKKKVFSRTFISHPAAKPETIIFMDSLVMVGGGGVYNPFQDCLSHDPSMFS